MIKLLFALVCAVFAFTVISLCRWIYEVSKANNDKDFHNNNEAFLTSNMEQKDE